MCFDVLISSHHCFLPQPGLDQMHFPTEKTTNTMLIWVCWKFVVLINLVKPAYAYKKKKKKSILQVHLIKFQAYFKYTLCSKYTYINVLVVYL